MFGDWVRKMEEDFMQDKAEALPLPDDLDEHDTLDQAYMSLVERARHWPDEWIEMGLKQGLEHERALLCRQAASRFGADTSERLSAVLAGITDQDRLTDIGVWLVRCDTGAEFLARAFPSPEGKEPSEA